MRKIISAGIFCAILLSAAISANAADEVLAMQSGNFDIPKSNTTVALDGKIDDGEYMLISSYAPTNGDWCISDYGPTIQYASESNPKHTIDLYASWDDNYFYVAVKASCPGHVANTDPVWNGCGVMCGFVDGDPRSGAYDSYTGYDAMSDVLHEIAFSVDEDGTINANHTTGDSVLDENTFIEYSNDGTYDYYELAFTWDFMGFKPEIGHELGWGFMYSTPNENAADGIDWVCFQTDIVNGKLPQTYPKVTLRDVIPVVAPDTDVVDTDVAADTTSAETTAPVTADGGIVAAAAVMAVAAGVVLSKKHR